MYCKNSWGSIISKKLYGISKMAKAGGEHGPRWAWLIHSKDKEGNMDISSKQMRKSLS
jgi:hypothetical protein